MTGSVELTGPLGSVTWGGPSTWGGLALDRPRVMGVLNVTPDSFSDGGTHLDPQRAIAAGLAMAAAGADIVDVGGESTRPGAPLTPPDAEQARVVPVIRALAEAGVRVSIDTRNAATMAAALDAGAAIVNDISALTHDPAAAGLVAARGCPVVLMHMRGEPATMNARAVYADIAREVADELSARIAAAEQAGIARDGDRHRPGHRLRQACPAFAGTAAPPAGTCRAGPARSWSASRENPSSAASASEPDPLRRLPGSLAAALFAVARGAHILRVHDVAETVQALRLWGALALDGLPPRRAFPAAALPRRRLAALHRADRFATEMG